jgi:hypothetical protein
LEVGVTSTMLVAKNDHVKISKSDAPVKALKDFDLAKAISSFSSDFQYIEESLTKGASTIFYDQFENWLIENEYVKKMKPKNVFSVNFDDRTSKISLKSSGLDDVTDHLEIPIRISVEEVGYGDCRTMRWSIKY